MKTKEEILKGDLTAEEVQYEIFEDGRESGGEIPMGGDYTTEEMIELIKNYAKRKCKEQRDICQQYQDGLAKMNKVPEPEFD